MTKKIFLALPFAAIAFSSNAEMKLTFDESFTISAGETKTLNIMYETTNPAEDAYAAFQFDVVLPEGLSVNYTTSKGKKVYKYTISEDFKDAEYGDDWSTSVPVANPNSFRFVYGNKSNDKLWLEDTPANTKDVLATLEIVADASYNGDAIRFERVTGNFGGITQEISGIYKACVLGVTGYSTFSIISSEFDGVLVSGATAYYGKVAETEGKDVIQLVEVDDNLIPNETGVILVGDPNAEVWCTTKQKIEAAADYASTYALVASDPSKNITGEYVLSVEGGVLGFYKYNGETMVAGKAYLPSSAVSSSLSRILFDTESAIEFVSTENNIEAIFNLQGQKMTEAKKGINIVNGKKVMY